MAQYAEVQGARGTPLLVDLVDVDSDKWRQYSANSSFPYSWLYKREANQLRSYERTLCERAEAVAVTTEREAQLVRKLCPNAHVHVIPNGVDQDYFKRSAAAYHGGVPTVCFVGDMSYFPNEQAVIFFSEMVLPLIRKTIPEIRFLIVGRQPGAKVERLKTMTGITVTGFVPDVRPFLAQSQVSVAPFMIASGIQNKILEAMSYGLPVVATSRIAQSLTASVAEMIEFADAPEELAAKIVGLLRDPERRERIGSEGRSRIAAEYSWTSSLDRLVGLVEDPAGSQAALLRD
jgi:sugar transferase (PEP-CTERM/EpsH1 system associated)